VLELETCVPEARRLAQVAGISDVVRHRAADVTSGDWGEQVDVVLVCNLLHHLQHEARSRLLRRAYEALAPGGTIAIWEPEAPSKAAPPELAGDAIALYFRITSSAPPVAAAELEAHVAAAGFAQLEIQRPLRARGRFLLHARKPLSTSVGIAAPFPRRRPAPR
jgi:2-polyprenyl-3-methyl-5-hydroxy-6-metoxy-1,4-benzoquinol methylase